jgi:hypothetical protein
MALRIHKLEFRFDDPSLNGGKASDRVTVGEWLDIEEGKRRPLVNILSRFAWYDDQPMDEAEATAKILSLDMTTFGNLIDEMKGVIQGEAVRPTNGTASEKPSDLA